MLERGLPDSVREHFRHVIRRWRDDARITQRDMAKKFGVTTGMYSHWETGFRFPTDDMLPRIAKELNITVEQLIGEPVRQPIQDVPVLGVIHAGKGKGIKPDIVEIGRKSSRSIEVTWGMYHDFAQESDRSLASLVVEGSAITPHFRSGDYVFVGLTADLPQPGQLLILQLPGVGYVLKSLIEGGDAHYLASLTPNVFPIPLPRKPKVWGVVRGVLGRR